MNIKKTIGILLVVLFLVSLTAASASAWYNKKGEIISPPETTKKVHAPAPVAVTHHAHWAATATTAVAAMTDGAAAAAEIHVTIKKAAL